MTTRLFSQSRRTCGLALMLLAMAVPVSAGPPLICDPFSPAAGAALLPWDDEGIGWNTPDPTYDRRRLVGDVLRLLNRRAPVLARMENMRRAAIYAAADAAIAGELLAAVTARTQTAPADPLAWFDAGYLIETYRQASHIGRWDMLTGENRRLWTMNRAPSTDGYAMVRKARALLPAPDAGIEFAASLMTTGAASTEHRRRAVSVARPGTDVARQLARSR